MAEAIDDILQRIESCKNESDISKTVSWLNMNGCRWMTVIQWLQVRQCLRERKQALAACEKEQR